VSSSIAKTFTFLSQDSTLMPGNIIFTQTKVLIRQCLVKSADCYPVHDDQGRGEAKQSSLWLQYGISGANKLNAAVGSHWL
jgi:hypothetical protein